MQKFIGFFILLAYFGAMYLFCEILPWEEGFFSHLSIFVYHGAIYLLYKIFTWAKALLVRYKIKSMVDISAFNCINYLNKFLDDKHKLDYRNEERNVEFILNDMNLASRNYYFKQKKYTLRQATVSSSLYFDFDLYNHLSCYDECESFGDRPLHVKIDSFVRKCEPSFEWSEESIELTTTFELTEFGLTFYKMLAAISKRCAGKKSIYFAPIYHDYQYVGESDDYIYCIYNDRAFEKLEDGKFTKTSPRNKYYYE